MPDPIPNPDVVSIRPFVPASDFEKSLRFYTDLSFTAEMYGGGVAGMQLGSSGFLLQEYDVPQFAGNFMMHMIVNDLNAWWQRIEALDLATKYGVRPPSAPKMQPWGLLVSYVVDPAGVLWHIAQRKN